MINKLDTYGVRIQEEIERAKVEGNVDGAQAFDVRGKLYALAMELAPEARFGDLVEMMQWLDLKGDERIVDLAAGGGFFTREFLTRTNGEVIAVDPSAVQISELDEACEGRATCIVGSPDSPEAMRQIADRSVDVVTSFGGLHHVADQRTMMEEVARIVRVGGQFTAADVCANTSLARHFDEFVAAKCLTGHEATWLSEARLYELTMGLPLRLERVEMVPLTWSFTSEREIALFFKGLHAYDLTEAEIFDDLREALGYTEKDGRLLLNWPMLFFRFVRL